MQFLASDNFICFRLQNYTIFFYNLLSFVYFLRINGEKYHRIVVLYSFCFCFFNAICLILLNPYSEWMQYSSRF